MKKDLKVTIVIVLAVLALAYVVISFQGSGVPSISEEIAKCIGENSVIYVQTGCSACTYQEELFGENYKHLEIINCTDNIELCPGVSVTPTWKINGELIERVQSIKKLKELTGC